MDIEEYKIRHGFKELPIWFYFQGVCFWVFPFAMLMGALTFLEVIPDWLGFVLLIPWCLFWGYKGFKKYKVDKLLMQSKEK